MREGYADFGNMPLQGYRESGLVGAFVGVSAGTISLIKNVSVGGFAFG